MTASPRTGPPTLGNGKICYLEMPASDVARSADFYRRLFGWHVRTRGDGSVAFDDAPGQVSGTWLTDREPGVGPGLLVSIMVDDAAATVAAIIAEGCEIVRPIGTDDPEITAWFRDPGGNIMGLYQEPARGPLRRNTDER
jgi:predicted enzyme related to lactoylglutathione lyase